MQTIQTESHSDRALGVKFYRRAVLNQTKSYGVKQLNRDGEVVVEIKGAGKPIYDDKDYVQIVIPAEKECQIDRPATFCGAPDGEQCRDSHPEKLNCDVHRFPRHWAAYRDGQKEQMIGTPLRNWPGILPSEVEDLAYHKVYTVEQLAGLSDSRAESHFHLRSKAQAYLEAAKKLVDGTEFADLKSDLHKRETESAELKKQLAAMQDQIAALTAAQKPQQPQKGAGK